MEELSKRYEPEEVERKWAHEWVESGAFSAGTRAGAPSFSIVIPPPNVTGALHIGHALNSTLQDILVRYKRMDGYNVLWMPGTDHAGIATQNVVERKLMEEKTDRQTLGREKFVERVWEWKSQYGGTIVNQLKTIGAGCDWERERFTMDEGLSRAVREVFVSLYEQGLIYRGEYMINWCPRCHTALSDLEVEHQEMDGSMWHIRYPLVADGAGPADGAGETNGSAELVIATTRPETMLGDTAVAVHPDDPRYKGMAGKSVLLPITNRVIPVIADEYVDMKFGSGALKITPAHDPNDFEIGERRGLDSVKVIGDDGTMTQEAGAGFAGMDRFEARGKIVEELKERGYLVKIEPHRHAVGTCYRCHTVVEPNVSKQWFVKIAPLAKPAIKAVEDGRVKFVPGHWANLYFEWMHNIRDWCISRQIWWGHRIPAWTCAKCGEVMVVREDPDKCVKCGHDGLEQESDVLDTWFSSALWPFSTMGWPEKTDDLARFYPTSALVTSFDIIFFWVARMIMMGLKFTGEVPFREVYIHALVRDAEGKKMSKSKGNTVDPLGVMSRYGADSLRMTLTALAAQGRDIKLSEERIEGYRNFTNKLWNASRFALMNLEGFDFSSVNVKRDDLALADRWILSRLTRTTIAVRKAFDEYRFNESASVIYQFVWGEFCDWYLEMIKPRLYGKEEGGQAARHTLAYTLERTLRLLHPIMPFVTEEVWQRVKPAGKMIVHAPYPKADEAMLDDAVEADMSIVMEITTTVRNIRAQMDVKPSAVLPAFVYAPGAPEVGEIITRQAPFMNRLANVEISLVTALDKKPDNCAVGVAGQAEVFLDTGSGTDQAERRAKLDKELGEVEKEIAFFTKKLSNKKFVDNAPPRIVEKDRAKLDEYKRKADKLREHVSAL